MSFGLFPYKGGECDAFTPSPWVIIHADESEREKEKLGNDLNNLISFKTGLTSSGRIIAEKAFYYASVLEELDEVKLYRESKAQRN